MTDRRVVRSRAAVVEAATTLFLRNGYAGTTVEEIAELAGLTKRTVYNNYVDKEALFTQIVTDVIAQAEAFAHGLDIEFTDTTEDDLPGALHDFAVRLALVILRPEVIALRRLLIGEARTFPALAGDYFERAPARVLAALATSLEQLDERGLLEVPDPTRAAEQFAYLVVGEPLDRAMLVGAPPSKERMLACARDGVETFLARYATTSRSTTQR